MELNQEEVYHHNIHGEVVVLGIHQVFNTYSPDDEQGIDSRGWFVRYATRWDDYGPMMHTITTESLDKFVDGVTEHIGTAEYVEENDD